MAYTFEMRFFGFLFFAACSGTGGECLRGDDWRDPIIMDSDTVTVQISQDCTGEIEITQATLTGPGFEADLPLVGDIVDGQDFAVEVRFVSDSPGDGEYQATLEISGIGLIDMPSRDLIYTVGDSSSDSGL
jgi:hypothetical protein